MACKRWLQRTIQMRWTRAGKWDMPNYTRTWLKSCGSNTSKFEVFGSTCCKYVRRRSGESYHIVFSLQQNVLEALSWFGEAFHPVSVGDRNWWNYEHRIFWFTMWKASDMQIIHLTFLNDLKHTANVKKKKYNKTLSIMDGLPRTWTWSLLKSASKEELCVFFKRLEEIFLKAA